MLLFTVGWDASLLFLHSLQFVLSKHAPLVSCNPPVELLKGLPFPDTFELSEHNQTISTLTRNNNKLSSSIRVCAV